MAMQDGLWLAGLALLSVLGVLLTVVRLPGTWLILIAALVYSWHFDWSRPPWPFLVVLAVLAVVGEIVEFFSSAVTARRVGASGRTALCATVGGVVGMFVFSVPLPVIGTIIGGLLGCFVGAVIAEVTVRRDPVHGAKVGLFAALGQILGMIGKMMIALVMAVAAVVAAIVRP